MAGELEAIVVDMFDGLAKNDADAALSNIASDAQGVDEISRRWIRGEGDVHGYVKQLVTMVSDVATTVSDAHETVSGDTGILTCWVEQDYVLEGEKQHVSAPTTVIFRRDGGAWKMILFHSIPVPPET